ncbi:MAG: MFS transporter [Clostridia bacterium]|nr:MFS transporter [Clostridia bacterium]
MATLLLLIIYVGFVSIGVPDSLFGASWPAVFPEFGVDSAWGGVIPVVCTCGTFVSSLFSGRLLSRFGTYRVTVFSAFLTALVLFCMSFTESFVPMLLLCIPLGLGSGAVDSGLNGYVALHYSARQMNFLHSCYGIGVMISPALVSFALVAAGTWSAGFRWVSLLQTGIAAVLLFSFPLWRKTVRGAEEEKVVSLGFFEMAKTRGVKGAWVLFGFACALEFTVGTWGTTYLVGAHDLSASLGALLVTFYYAGIASGRFVAGLLAKRVGAKYLVFGGSAVVALAIAALFLPLSGVSSAVVLFFIGAGLGPVYPNLMHLCPVIFGRERSQSLTGSFLAAASLGIISAPSLFGLVSSVFGIGALPFFAAGIFLVFLLVLPKSVFATDKGKDCT